MKSKMSSKFVEERKTHLKRVILLLTTVFATLKLNKYLFFADNGAFHTAGATLNLSEYDGRNIWSQEPN